MLTRYYQAKTYLTLFHCPPLLFLSQGSFYAQLGEMNCNKIPDQMQTKCDVIVGHQLADFKIWKFQSKINLNENKNR